MSSPNADLGCGSLTLKYLVFLFNLLFFLCGLVLIVIGGIAQGFFREYISFLDNEFATPGTGLIILGTVIMIVSFFGCCGARMENAFMLRVFSFLLVLLFVCEVAAGISVAILKSDIQDVINDNMNKTMYRYQEDTYSIATDAWDNLQINLNCCGINNYTDWKPTAFANHTDVPETCCKRVFHGCAKNALINETVADGIHQAGCIDSLEALILKNLGAIVGAAVALSIIQVIGIWMSCRLVKAVKDAYEEL